MSLLFAFLLFVILPIDSAALNQTEKALTSITRCEDIRKAPKELRCTLVSELCPEDSRKGTLSFDYLSTYYCRVQSHSVMVQLLFWVFLVVLAVVLFSLLGDTAEKYFSPALTQICQQVPKMRPRFAGVTVLAFANGAPDLSATINAIKTCKFDLSLGALTGAGMFVNCFVAGWIILISGGAKCRGATIRDVSIYFLTITGVLIALFINRMGVAAVVFAFLLYVGFVLAVFGADEWHEQGRPDFWSRPIDQIAASFRRQTNDNERRLLQTPVWAEYNDDDNNKNENYEPASQTLVNSGLIEESVAYPVVWAQLSPDQYRQQALAEMAGSEDEFYDYPLENLVDDFPISPQVQEGGDMMPRTTAGILPFETEQVLVQDESSCWLCLMYPWLGPLWEKLLMDDLPSKEDGVFTKALLVLRFPLLVLQRATIPLTSKEHYSRSWLIVALWLSPFMWLVYLSKSTWIDVIIAFLIGSGIGIGASVFTKELPGPPVWSMGTSWPIGASIIALYGLVVGIFWIDILAGELVDLLYCAGTITGIPEAVLGLTVLAWGNSIGDFFTNRSIAKAGKGNMAITACYAGPVFNMLMGLGLGFISFFSTQHRSQASIHVQPQVRFST